MRKLIACLTDFGLKDYYVGAMKGVISSINPSVQLIDLSHEVPPQDVSAAAYILKCAYTYFPPNTIFLVVVDPGVGGERKGIILKTAEYFFVAPDNGVLGLISSEPQRIIHLTNRDYWLSSPSHVFHGRDIFAPVAAHLSKGVALEEFGAEIDELTRLPSLKPVVEKDAILGEVIYIDRFGNLVTNINRESSRAEPAWRGMVSPASHEIDGKVVVEIRGHRLSGIKGFYSQVEPGQMLALWGSSGHLEISVNGGDAGRALGVERGEKVKVYDYQRSHLDRGICQKNRK
ncbi:MAG: SAM-dependent chlorinase/fluorinase [bacterium]|nr:SAM-dependent chlorinase/fluorinase [bacterium]